MRNSGKVLLGLAACLILTGCPEVKSISGEAQYTEHSFFDGTPHDMSVTQGGTVAEGTAIRFTKPGSITLAYKINGKECDLTFTTDFLVPALTSCPDQQENKKEKEQEKEQEQQQDNAQQQPQDQQPPSEGAENGVNTQGSPGINAPAVTPTTSPYSAGSGIGGPQVLATSVPAYTRIMSVVTNPIVTNTLAVVGALSVAKEVHDQTDGNNGDKPVSK